MTPISGLHPLCDGRPGLRCTIQTEIHSPSDSEIKNQNSKIENCLDFISSDPTLDRYGEIISPAGWRLENYRRNPVFQNAHNYGNIIFTLGRALITEIRHVGRAVPGAPPPSQSPNSDLPSSCLYQRIQFATDANPLAKIAYALYAGKFLNAVSVGFIPIRWEDAEVGRAVPSARPIENQNSKIKNSPSCRRKYLEQELLEVSAVSIPANPNALTLALKSGAVGKSDLKDTADLINYTLAATALTTAAVPQSKIDSLLSLARQIQSQLRHL